MTFAGGHAARVQAVRVTFASLPEEFAYAEGRTMWVQEPYVVTEASGSAGPSPAPKFLVAELGCEPYYRDWSEGACVSGMCVGGLLDGQRWPCTFDDECRRVDVIDAGIIPEGVYEVRFIDIECSTEVPEAYSDPLVVTMSGSGDIVGDYDPVAGWWTGPNGVVDFNDISACVEKFKNSPGAPRKARCDIINSDIMNPLPDKIVDFVDISCIVAAFGGTPCSLPGPPVVDPCD